MRHLLLIFIILFVILSVKAYGQNQSWGILVDGGYSPNEEDSDIDEMLDDRLDETEEELRRIDPDIDIERIASEDALERTLEGIECRCGDVINVVWVGHGGTNSLAFTKPPSSRMTADELRELLEDAAVECCCKINVVIFACHSGSNIDDLFEGEHIESVFTSSLEDERSHSNGYYDEEGNFVDEGDWIRGFHQDLEEVARGTSMGDAFAEAAKSAREKNPRIFRNAQTPDGWRRGDYPVRFHVERKISSSSSTGQSKYRVVYYEPEWMRGKTEYIYIPDSVLEQNELRLRRCMWMSATATFGSPEDHIVTTGPVERSEPPSEEVLAHVRRKSGNKLRVHTIDPPWTYCDEQDIEVEDREQFGEGLRRCVWIRERVMFTDPYDDSETDQPIEVVEPEFEGKFHVTGYNARTGIVSGNFLPIEYRDSEGNVVSGRRYWLLELIQYRGLRLPEEVARRIGFRLEQCTNIYIKFKIGRDRIPEVIEISEMHQDQSPRYSLDLSLSIHEAPEQLLSPSFMATVDVFNNGDLAAPGSVYMILGEQGRIDLSEFSEWSRAYEEESPTKRTEYLASDQFGGTQIMRTPLEEIDPGHHARIERRLNARYGSTLELSSVVVHPEDEVVRNNDASILFRHQRRTFDAFQELEDQGLECTARGTGRTTGHIIDLIINNPTEEAVSGTLPPFLIPGDNYQPYLIPGTTEFGIDPNSTTVISRDGYCINIHKPPIPFGESAPDPTTTWVPLFGIPWPETNEIPSYGQPGLWGKDSITVTSPGTDVPLGHTIDLQEQPEIAGPFLQYGIESLERTYERLKDEGAINTPLSSNPEREREAIIQQGFWKYASELLNIPPYEKGDFLHRSREQMEAGTGVPYAEQDEEVQEELDRGLESIWDAVQFTGTEAKLIATQSGE